MPKRSRVRDWLHELSASACQAAQRALKSKTAARTVKIGASGSSSAEFDVATETHIISRVRDAPIPLDVVSEELGEVRRGADWSVIIDPVDGSRNAARNIPFYCVSLALARRDLSGVEMGIVQSIPTREVYFAEKGRGATLEGRPIRPRAMDHREIVVGAAVDYEKGIRFPKRPHVHFRDLGSAALEMCLVADGRLDGFVCPNPLIRIIDVAASTLIVLEAGGRVWDLHRKPLNAPLVVRNRFSMVAVGDPKAWRVLR